MLFGPGQQSSNGKCPWSKNKPSLHYCLWLGCCLAGLAGLMAAPIMTVEIGMGEGILNF
ncbi:MAG: hypothetical protein CM1200mP30_25070 [Pseudomonadota bacterium]|nr:MAG: hypothetical protein CM1200mP30_25070 [Pseudomonadota bacterium]